ncbi:MAG: hypothetical protein ACT4P2_04970 [Pseudomonadota bacterium]
MIEALGHADRGELLQAIREAARQCGLPADYIAFLDRVEARE